MIVLKVNWSIEIDPAAASAFKQNHVDATVINEDSNKVLRTIIDDDEKLMR